MVSVCRHNRHLHDDRFHRLFEPALPFPFTVIIRACVHKVTREDTKACIFLVTRHRVCAHTRFINILFILQVTVRHIDKRKLTLLLIRCPKMTYLTPVALVSYPPTVLRTRLQIRCHRLMTHVPESGVLVHLRFFQDS